MPFVASGRMDTSRVRLEMSLSMLVTGEFQDLCRIGKEAATLYGGKLHILLYRYPEKNHLLITFDNGIVPDLAHDLVKQRMTEGFQVEIETGVLFLQSYRWEHEQPFYLPPDPNQLMDDHPF